MATNITQPDVLAKPFAADGEKNTIPVAATGTNKASLSEGFPPITGRSVVDDDGIPPEKDDFNGLGYLLSQFCFALQNGWFPTFDADVSTAIGGYPLGAVLWYATGNYFVKSLKANNTDNFVSDPSKIDGVSWQQITVNSVSGKADTDLSNITATGKANVVNLCVPDYANGTSSSGSITLPFTQCSKTSQVVLYIEDPFQENYEIYVSPDNGTTKYLVGKRYDDNNGNTEGTCFSFVCPKNWYFGSNINDNGATWTVNIYPLKGE